MKRIETIVNFIKPYKNIADVGCDHGYVIKLANDNNMITLAYAIDNKQAPLNRCMQTLENYKNVKYFLSDGLDAIDEKIECVIIAGMGGTLIEKILSENKDKLQYIKRLIIQANKDQYVVRKYLCDNDFYIYDEEIVKENGKYYEIDVFEHGNKKYDFDDLYFGKILIEKKDKYFIEKWMQKYNKYSTIDAFSNDLEKIKIMEGIKKILCK